MPPKTISKASSVLSTPSSSTRSTIQLPELRTARSRKLPHPHRANEQQATSSIPLRRFMVTLLFILRLLLDQLAAFQLDRHVPTSASIVDGPLVDASHLDCIILVQLRGADQSTLIMGA